MAKAIAGFFRTLNEGEQARTALYQGGFTTEEVGFLAGDTRGHQTPAIGPVLKETGSESEAATDAWVGAAIGLAAGVVVLAIPGVGLLAAGPIAGAIGGLTAGATVGGLIGILKDHGVSEEQAQFYAEGVKRGGALVTVRGVDEDREKTARKILDDAGAIQVEQLEDEWRASGWEGPKPKILRAG